MRFQSYKKVQNKFTVLEYEESDKEENSSFERFTRNI